MAEKRMFTQKIIDSDAFLDMPLSTQALYFHLNMRADDDGFVNNPKRIQRTIGASEDDLKLLIAKRFIIGFDSGVIVIKHWRMHNTLRKDRYKATHYQEEFSRLSLKDNDSYTERLLLDNQTATNWQPNDNQTETQISIDKYSVDKESKEEDIGGNARTDFQHIVNLYNSICTSLPKVQSLSVARRKAIKARLNTYSVEQFELMFKKAEASCFLKGKNKTNWQANFDWLIKDSNFAKVLDGNYDDKGNNTNNTGNDNNILYGGDYI